MFGSRNASGDVLQFNATMAGRAVAPSAWYSALRDKPFPTLYGENRTAVTADVLEAGLILAFCILTFAFLLLIPGVRGGQVSTPFLPVFKPLGRGRGGTLSRMNSDAPLEKTVDVPRLPPY